MENIFYALSYLMMALFSLSFTLLFYMARQQELAIITSIIFLGFFVLYMIELYKIDNE